MFNSILMNITICIPGMPNWYLNSPVFSKIWTRWLFVSATIMSCSTPKQKPCGELNWHFPGPNWPNLHLKLKTHGSSHLLKSLILKFHTCTNITINGKRLDKVEAFPGSIPKKKIWTAKPIFSANSDLNLKIKTFYRHTWSALHSFC